MYPDIRTRVVYGAYAFDAGTKLGIYYRVPTPDASGYRPSKVAGEARMDCVWAEMVEPGLDGALATVAPRWRNDGTEFLPSVYVTATPSGALHRSSLLTSRDRVLVLRRA